MKAVPIISRVVFNFTSKCNLSCPFCYVPFDGIDSRLDLWRRIISRCKEWKPRVITFGGGDPFLYSKEFPLLLQSTADNETFIQVDTNGLALCNWHIPIIKQCVHLVGLPIDGSKEIHTAMRRNPRHFTIVVKWLQRFADEGVPIKINTVVSKVNIHDLDNIAKLLMDFPIRVWSLYQFWPLGPGKNYRSRFEVSTQEFLRAAEAIKGRYNFARIEISAISDRLLCYFFVSHTGRVYVVDRHNYEQYIELGNIFDDDILMKWQGHGDPIALSARASLRENIKAKP